MNGIRSILLITSNPQEDILSSFGVDVNHPTVDQMIINPESSIGIDDIRDIKAYSLHRPLNSDQKTIVLLKAETLTPEAQNALLKLLEEPPEYLTTILVATNTQVFLDTILSRCNIIRSNGLSISRSSETTHIQQLLALTPAKRLAEIPLGTKSKAPAIEYCTKLVHEAESLLKKNPTKASVSNLKILNHCLTHLSLNANPTMALSDSLLRLSITPITPTSDVV